MKIRNLIIIVLLILAAYATFFFAFYRPTIDTSGLGNRDQRLRRNARDREFAEETAKSPERQILPGVPGYDLCIDRVRERTDDNYWEQESLSFINKKTGEQQLVIKAPSIYEVAWSPDKKHLAVNTWMGSAAIDLYIYELRAWGLKEIDRLCVSQATGVPALANHEFFYILKWLNNKRLAAKTSVDFWLDDHDQAEDIYGYINTAGVYTLGQGYRINKYDWDIVLIVNDPDLAGLDKLKPAVTYKPWDAGYKYYKLYRVDVNGPITAARMRALLKCFPSKTDAFYAHKFKQYAWQIDSNAKKLGRRGSIPAR